MRDGNRQQYFCYRAGGEGLNEGWPECGMETELVELLLLDPVLGLNEGWPECGMETTSLCNESTHIGRLNEGWPECGMETHLILHQRLPPILGLNEGWPEGGMETQRGRQGRHFKWLRLNEGWPECGMETYEYHTTRLLYRKSE